MICRDHRRYEQGNHGRHLCFGSCCTAILFALIACEQYAGGEEPHRDGGWLIERDEQTGIQVHTMEMTLHARAEPRPALKYRFIPDEFDMLDGNAATYYLKAEGFFEQNPARERLSEIYAKAREQARKEDTHLGQVPPFNWQHMTPGELPVEEVKEYLKLLSFQPWLLKQAAKQGHFDLDRHIHTVENPMYYLLAEIQALRETARMQSLRCRVAIAEGRIDDAIEILGQQYAMARHFGQDDFLVTALVGTAISGIAGNDALHLIQHADTPNLYWAFASLPQPLVDVQYAMSVERQFLYLQVKLLREVDETPRPAGYWQDFLDRLVAQVDSFAVDFGLPVDDPEIARAMMVGYIVAAYPGAKRYLLEDIGMSQRQVEAYPIAQVVFLAVVRYYDETRDDYFKWTPLPYWQSQSKIDSSKIESLLKIEAERVGWITAPTQWLLPGLFAVPRAVASNQQRLALLQTVEAIRMYGAAHDSALPPNLEDLPVPAPVEPFTGKPFDYQFHDDHAMLNGHAMPGLQYRLVLRFATE